MDSSVLGCFLVGVAVGVGIGMVAAPQTGRQTRRSVNAKADEATGYLRQRRVALRDCAADLTGGRRGDTSGEEAMSKAEAFIRRGGARRRDDHSEAPCAGGARAIRRGRSQWHKRADPQGVSEIGVSDLTAFA
jgi:hypothetical protein